MPESASSAETNRRRSPELVCRQASQLIVIDVQEKLLPAICGADQVRSAITFLLQAAEILGVTVYVSEQYPKGLGATVPEILQHTKGAATFDKIRFSAADGYEEVRRSADDRTSQDQVVIVGIESHVCVLQTAFDLLAHGLRVFVVEDAVGSRHSSDKATALRRLREAGAVVTSTESVVFEWCETAGTAEFRSISKLIQQRDVDRQQANGCQE